MIIHIELDAGLFPRLDELIELFGSFAPDFAEAPAGCALIQDGVCIGEIYVEDAHATNNRP